MSHFPGEPSAAKQLGSEQAFRRRQRLAFRGVAVLAGIVVGWQLVAYLVTDTGSSWSWTAPVVSALLIQLAIMAWRIRDPRARSGLVALIALVGPSIVLGLISRDPPRADVLYFLASMIGFLAAQIIVPPDLARTRGPVR